MQFKDPDKKIITATLGFVIDGDKVLLGEKKRGFGKGYWNGFGGKPELGESLEEALVREFQEECCIEIHDFEKKAEINFDLDMEEFNLIGHIYRINGFIGEPQETEEMKPQWFFKNQVPYDMMWKDDKDWLPLFFAGKQLEAYFHFKDTSTILKKHIQEI